MNMKLSCCRRQLFALRALVFLLSVRYAHPQEGKCDVCSSTDGSATFSVKPGTGCVEYVQCVDGENIGDFSCSGETIFDEKKGYCNWNTETTCIEPIITCPPTKMPSTDAPTPSAIDCPNPCPVDATGSYTVPGSRCKKYVQCDGGKPEGEQLECFGETIFNQNAGYCDWPHSYTCRPVECPERDPTQSPSEEPTMSPLGTTITIQINSPDIPEVLVIESDDCPNPCPVGYSGMQIRPGSQCKKYVQCDNGELMAELECTGGLTFNPFGQYCDWAVTCGKTPCPTREPTQSPAAPIHITVPQTPSVISIPVEIHGGADFYNPCEWTYSGLEPKPFTQCKEYVECDDGEVVGEFTCSGEDVFVREAGECKNMIMEGWTCRLVEYQSYSPTITQQPSDVILGTSAPSTSPTPRPISTPQPTTPRSTPQPTAPRLTPQPTSAYQYFRQYLFGKEQMLKSVVFQSNGSPSTEYTFSDFVSSLDVAVFQLPADKSFFVGDGMSGRLPKLSSMEYGLVNLAAFFANAMEEGIRIDSCDEWNTDTIRDKYPLSNSCGQHGRHYEDEQCTEMEPFQCSLDKTMGVTAVHSDAESKAPPLTCQAKTSEDGSGIFPGYYDRFDDVVVQSPYANTLGRTDIEGCCWWGRGVMMTRGRCTIGKLDKYLGPGAVDRGIFVYPDVPFCSNPEVICNHERSREFRWVIGLLEWSDRVQSYVNLDTGWNYLDELKKFVDGGMNDDEFINAVINIFTRNCHNDRCSGQWKIDDENVLAESARRGNFRKIIFEVWNLPMTYHPTESPSLPRTRPPTRPPSVQNAMDANTIRTNKPTRRNRGNQKPQVIGLQPNSVPPSSMCSQYKCYTFAIFIPILFLWA